jgi:uncharacterized protein YodC (DUF2158 family)
MFNPGDLVKLKSGGAQMVAASVEGTDVLCMWHGAEQTPCSAFYPETVLVAIEAKKPAQASASIGALLGSRLGK